MKNNGINLEKNYLGNINRSVTLPGKKSLREEQTEEL